MSGAINGSVTIWNLETQSPHLNLDGHKLHISAAAFLSRLSKDEPRRLATSSLDRTVRIWDIEHGTPLMTFRCRDAATDVIHDPETDQIFAVDATGRIYAWRTRAVR